MSIADHLLGDRWRREGWDRVVMTPAEEIDVKLRLIGGRGGGDFERCWKRVCARRRRLFRTGLLQVPAERWVGAGLWRQADGRVLRVGGEVTYAANHSEQLDALGVLVAAIRAEEAARRRAS